MWHFLFLAFQWHRANGVLSSYPWPSFCTRSQTSIELLWRKMYFHAFRVRENRG